MKLSEIAGLAVHGIGKKTSNDATRLQHPRILDAFALVFLAGGEGTCESERLSRSAICQGDVLFLFPGEMHLYGPLPGTSWKEQWVLFSGAYPEMLDKKGCLPPVRRSGEAVRGKIAGLLEQAEIQHQYSWLRTDCTASVYHALLMILDENSGRLQSAHAQGETAYMQQLLRQHLLSPLPVSAYFRTDQHSYHTLRQKFLTRTGLSPKQYQMQLRMRRAEELLLWSDLPVGKVAASVGITDPLYFSKRFKQFAGISPVQYRKSVTAGLRYPPSEPSGGLNSPGSS